MPFALFSTRRPLRNRLWLGGFGLAVLLAVLIAGNALVAPERAVRAPMFGYDFLAFYSAGRLVREGQADRLYDIPSIRATEQAVSREAGLRLGDAVGPWWNPPFCVWPFVPLAGLPFRLAVAVWMAINLAALACALLLLCRILARPPGPGRRRPRASPRRASSRRASLRRASLRHASLRHASLRPGPLPLAAPREPWKTWALAPLLLLVSMPFVLAFCHGQNTFCSLLMLCGAVAAWRSGRAVAAGFVAGLLFYKPQLGAAFAAVLVFSLGWRALLGLALTGSALLLVNLVTLPGSLGDYLRLLPANVRYMQVENVYLWERHVTLKAFWRLLLQGREAGAMSWPARAMYFASCAALGGCLVAAMVRCRQTCRDAVRPEDTRRAVDRLIAATVATMPLLMPFYFDYDLLLLAVPAVLFARDRLDRASDVPPADPHRAGSPVPPPDRWLVRGWVALFLWLFVNQAIARLTRVNLTVPLLTGIAALLIARALRRESATGRLAAPAEATRAVAA